MIRQQHGLAGVGHGQPEYKRAFNVGGGQPEFHAQPVGPDKGGVPPKLVQRRVGQRAYRIHPVGSIMPPQQDYAEVWRVQLQREPGRVCDHRYAPLSLQVRGQLEARRPGIHEYLITVGDQLPGQSAHNPLGLDVSHSPGTVRKITILRERRPAVLQLQLAGLGQGTEIPPNRRLGNRKDIRQRTGCNLFFFIEFRQYYVSALSCRRPHGIPYKSRCSYV